MIRVSIESKLIAVDNHDTLTGVRIMEGMRSAGIPVIGHFVLHGLTHGKLTIDNVVDNGNNGKPTTRFTWQENEQDTNGVFKFIRRIKNGAEVYMSGAHFDKEDEL